MADDAPARAASRLLVRPAEERHLRGINEIYNDEVLHGTATWEDVPWPIERRREWFAEHDDRHPVFVAVDPKASDGEIAGFGYLSAYRPKIGYRFTREDTVYVHPDHRGEGVGRLLLGSLIEEARRLGVHVIYAVIEASNAASIELHRALGFEQTGFRREAGFKFGRWLSSVEMEIVLPRALPAPDEGL
jgi:phosphinothricin acetyltransferase